MSALGRYASVARFVMCVTLSAMASFAFGQLIEVRDGGSRFSTNIAPGAHRASERIPRKQSLWGDVNGDGVVSLSDAAVIKSHLLEETLLAGDALTSADANRDRIINMADVAYVNTHISPAVLADNAVFVQDVPQLTVTNITSPVITLKWSGGGPPPLHVGDIISGTSPVGFLRRITSIAVKGSTVTLQTADASMANAVQSGQFSSHVRFDGAQEAAAEAPTPGAPRLLGGPGLNWDLSGIVLFQKDNLTLDIPSGHISFDPELDIDWDISWFRLKYFRLDMESVLDVEIDVRALAELQREWEKEFDIPGLRVAKRFVIGYLEGKIEACVKAKIEVTAGAKASATTGFQTECRLRFACEYSRGRWHTEKGKKFTFTGDPVVLTIEGEVTARVTLVPQVSIIFYEVAGPTASLEPWLEAWGRLRYLPVPARLDYALRAGLDVTVGISFGVLDSLIDSIEFGRWTIWGPKDLISGCIPPPGAIKETTVMLPGNVPLVMVRVGSGVMKMGSNDGSNWSWCYPGEQPVHTVSIPHAFEMGKFEVTQSQWMALMGSWPHRQPDDTFGVGLYYPAYFISWNDCQNFVRALNTHMMRTGQENATFRLPSEAEWEYACRAGSEDRFFFGNSTLQPDEIPGPNRDSDLDAYAWFGWPLWYATHTVGTKKPNLFGLYDMYGNVDEWCQDWYHSGYTGAPSDGRAWEIPVGTERVSRGGSYVDPPKFCRSASRRFGAPNSAYYSVGFRVVRGL